MRFHLLILRSEAGIGCIEGVDLHDIRLQYGTKGLDLSSQLVYAACIGRLDGFQFVLQTIDAGTLGGELSQKGIVGQLDIHFSRRAGELIVLLRIVLGYTIQFVLHGLLFELGKVLTILFQGSTFASHTPVEEKPHGHNKNEYGNPHQDEPLLRYFHRFLAITLIICIALSNLPNESSGLPTVD